MKFFSLNGGVEDVHEGRSLLWMSLVRPQTDLQKSIANNIAVPTIGEGGFSHLLSPVSMPVVMDFNSLEHGWCT